MMKCIRCGKLLEILHRVLTKIRIEREARRKCCGRCMFHKYNGLRCLYECSHPCIRGVVTGYDDGIDCVRFLRME